MNVHQSTNNVKLPWDKPAVALDPCTYRLLLGRTDGLCPIRPDRRPAVSVPAGPGPSGAAPARSAAPPPRQPAALPSPSPEVLMTGRSKLHNENRPVFSLGEISICPGIIDKINKRKSVVLWPNSLSIELWWFDANEWPEYTVERDRNNRLME